MDYEIFYEGRSFKLLVDPDKIEDNEQILPYMEEFFEYITDDEDSRKNVFMKCIHAEIFGNNDYRPILIDKTLGKLKNPLDDIANTFLAKLGFPLSSAKNKEFTEFLIEKSFFKRDPFVILRCNNGHFTIAQELVGKLKCVCGAKVSIAHKLYFWPKTLSNIFRAKGRIIEYFLFRYIKNILNNNEVRIEQNLKLWTKEGGILEKIFPKPLAIDKDSFNDLKEIDLGIKYSEKLLVIFSSTNPTDPSEKEQFKRCIDLGIDTLFVSTSGERELETYKIAGGYIFPDIYKTESLEKLITHIREFLNLEKK